MHGLESSMVPTRKMCDVLPFFGLRTTTRKAKHPVVFRNHVGLVGFEPTASWSRTRRSTKLSHSPKKFAEY